VRILAKTILSAMKTFTNVTELRLSLAASPVALLTVLMMNSSVAKAEQDDFFSPFVTGAYHYDDNFFRLQSDQAALTRLGTTDKAESYSVLSAGANLNWQVSRQHIKAKAEFSHTRFDRYKVLDFDGHDTSLQWDWLLGSVLSGDVGAKESVVQGSFVNIQQPINNLITQRQAFAHGAIQVGAPWKIKFGAEKLDSKNSLPSLQTQDSNVDTYNAGLQYQTRAGNVVEFISEMSNGNYPNRQIVGVSPVDNTDKQWDNGVAVSWKPTGKTTLKGRLNYTKRSYNDVPQRDFSGITGLLSDVWQVTEKTSLGMFVYRNIGVVESTTASYSVNRGVAATVAWKATAKLTFNLNLAQDRLTYSGDPGFVLSTTPARQDRLTSLQFGANYQVLRNTTLGLNLQHGVNHSNQALASYRYNSVMLNVRSEF
jgi:exopolysaccharide biosynthesis operon protein EpsL